MARDRAARPEAAPLRLFVAIDIPDQAKASLFEVVDGIKGNVPGARWTGREGWHVTLKFLGSTWPRLLDEVQAAVRSTAEAADSLETHLTHLGVFPSPARARVLWTGLSDPDGRLRSIAKGLDERLERHFRPEKRPFSPHLTVARMNPPQDLRGLTGGVIGMPVESPPFLVDRLVLYRSHLSPRGARYEPLAVAELGQARGE